MLLRKSFVLAPFVDSGLGLEVARNTRGRRGETDLWIREWTLGNTKQHPLGIPGTAS